jgi:hypothetical protein
MKMRSKPSWLLWNKMTGSIERMNDTNTAGLLTNHVVIAYT